MGVLKIFYKHSWMVEVDFDMILDIMGNINLGEKQEFIKKDSYPLRQGLFPWLSKLKN